MKNVVIARPRSGRSNLVFAILVAFGVSLTPSASALIPDEVLREATQKTLKDLFQAYSRKDWSGFMDRVAADFEGSNGFDKGDLANSLNFDFESLDNLRLSIQSVKQLLILPGEPQKTVAVVGWNRNAELASGEFQRWMSTGTTEFTFIIEEDEEGGEPGLKLAFLRGDLIFGLTNYKEEIFLERGGRLIGRFGQATQITQRLVVRDGEIDGSGSTTRGTNTIFTPAAAGAAKSFDFKRGQGLGTVAAGDVNYPVAVSIAATAPAGIINLGAIDFESLKEVPTSGYTTGPVAVAVSGDVLAVRTKDGNFAKMRVIGADLTGVGQLDFEWVFQTVPGINRF